MYRSGRDTGEWFQKETTKGSLKDKKFHIAMGPGMYNPGNQPLSDKKKVQSWNYGAVPFGTCKERFNSENRQTQPGPGQYESSLL